MGDIADCVVCGHTTHRVNACAVCGCKDWKRADHLTAQGILNINNWIFSEGRTAASAIVDILDILCTQFPEAEQAVIARREQLRKERESDNSSPTNTTNKEETSG